MAFCSKCGTEVTSGVKFCPNCGNVMDTNNYGGAPMGYAPVKPATSLNIDFKSPKVILSLAAAFCAIFTLIGGFMFAFDYADLEGIGVLYIFAMLFFITPVVLNILYFLNIGGLAKNNILLTISFASTAAYGLFYFITTAVQDAELFSFYTLLMLLAILASAGLAVYCSITNFAKPILFFIAMFVGAVFEAGILADMQIMTHFLKDEVFLIITVLFSFLAKMATYLTYSLFAIDKIKESSY